MSYYNIEKNAVYMSHGNYRKILVDELKVSDYSGFYISGSNGQPSKERTKHEALVYDFLLDKFKTDFEGFRKNYLDFELVESEARDNIWDLLYDYCIYYGHSLLIDLRDEHKQMIDDLNGDTSIYLPMGNTFVIAASLQKNRFKIRNILKSFPKTNILINANKIIKIDGRLEHFQVSFENGSSIKFFNGISIRPY